MEQKQLHLGEAELEIMQQLWVNDLPLTANQILSGISGRKWALSTLMTVLNRLADKGFLTCDRGGKTNLYTPLIKKSDYQAAANRNFLERMYGNSVPRLVASLYESHCMTEEDVQSLREYLDRLEKGEV